MGAEALPPAVLGPSDHQQLRLENETLSAVVAIIGSSPDLQRVLARVVDLLTRATDCHACFIYLRADAELRLRAASPIYAHLIGQVRFGVDEGLAGWSVRHGQPGFIRDDALSDPRTKYVPELEEERFQSIVAVPIPAREGRALGAIVLHTVAPREFDEGIIAVLSRAAALVAGAIENATLFEESQQRVQALTRWTGLAQRLAAAADRNELYRLATTGARALLPCDHAHLYELDAEDRLRLVSADPPTEAALGATTSARVVLDLLASPSGDEQRLAAVGRELGLPDAPGAAMAIPLSAGNQQRGVLVVAAREPWRAHGADLTRALGHLLALALDKADLIEHLTVESVSRELFDALGQGDPARAASRARAAGFDLDRAHVVVHARAFAAADDDWEVAGPAIERAVRAAVPGAICDVGARELRCLVPAAREGPQPGRDLVASLDRVAEAHTAAIGLSDARRGAAGAMRSLTEAIDASRLAQALNETPASLLYRDAGAYRYLAHLLDEETPRDHLHEAVERLAAYDARRRATLLPTLERYLEAGRAYAPTARALNIHVNTLRQRLQRAEDVSGLSLDNEDLLSLQLVIKLTRARR